MKATYSGFEAKKANGFTQLPPPGAYIGEIQGVRTEESYDKTREEIVLMLEITEGDYKDQYHKVFEDQKNRFDSVKYKGTFKLRPFVDGDEAWVRNRFEGNLWCVEQSNPGYAWDWDENKLKGKKIGFSVRKNIYTGKDGTPKETTEIGQLETVDDVRNGRCKPMKDRVQKGAAQESRIEDASAVFADVSRTVDVPF